MNLIPRIEPYWHGRGPEYDEDKYSSSYGHSSYDNDDEEEDEDEDNQYE